MRRSGHSRPLDRIAARTRWGDSRPAASGRPTRPYPGSPFDTCTSTLTARLRMPSSVPETTVASMRATVRSGCDSERQDPHADVARASGSPIRWHVRSRATTGLASMRVASSWDVDGFVATLSSLSPHTRRAYAHDAQEFVAWCERGGCADPRDVDTRV